MCDFLQSICALVIVELRICAAFNSVISLAYSFVRLKRMKKKNQCGEMIQRCCCCCCCLPLSMFMSIFIFFDSIVIMFTAFRREFSISKSRCYLRTLWSNITQWQHSMGTLLMKNVCFFFLKFDNNNNNSKR